MSKLNQGELRRPRGSIALLVALVAALLISSVAFAGSGPQDENVLPTIAVRTRETTIAGCTATRVEIWAADVADLYAIDVRIAFDPTLLQVVDADPNTPGVQITPLGDFLQPGFVARNVACNADGPADPYCTGAGLIWYAATQLLPAQPVSGTGPLAAIDFVGSASGISALEITNSQPVDIDGYIIPASTRDSRLTVQQPAAPETAISLLTPTTVRLSWPAVGDAGLYRIYRDSAPYFTPAEPPYATTGLLAYDDAGAAGDAAIHHFYVMQTGCSTGLLSPAGNRVGEFDYDLVR